MRRNKSDEESCGQASCMRVRNNNNDGLIIRFHTKYQSLEEVMKFKSHFHFLIRLYLNLIRYDFVFFFLFHILIRIIMSWLAQTPSTHAPSTYVCHLSRTYRATSAIATVTRPCQITIYSFLRARHVSPLFELNNNKKWNGIVSANYSHRRLRLGLLSDVGNGNLFGKKLK